LSAAWNIYTAGPNGKLEWKRYKQYTKDDILAAIEEVKSGECRLVRLLLFIIWKWNR
jgi:hypothetical protein